MSIYYDFLLLGLVFDVLEWIVLSGGLEGGGGGAEEGRGRIRSEIIFLKTLTRPLYEYHIFFTNREITCERNELF